MGQVYVKRMMDFGKGLGLGLFLGVPVTVTILAFARQDVFAFGYMRELGLTAIWATAVALVVRWKFMKVGTSGIEIHLGSEPVPPAEAVPQKSGETNQ
jgi:hypothetical protein